jgi:hypothetical protein
MSDKASAAGWVIEVRRLASPPHQEPPQNAYYNVAVPDAVKATVSAVAVAKKAGFEGTGRHVRPLSEGEIEVLRLKPGEVHPA